MTQRLPVLSAVGAGKGVATGPMGPVQVGLLADPHGVGGVSGGRR